MNKYSFSERLDSHSSSGVGLVELIIATAIISIAIFGLWQASVLILTSLNLSEAPQEALFLAQEGMEAVRSMRDECWAANIAPLTNNLNYYFSTSSTTTVEWVLTTTNPGSLNGKYTRYAVFSELRRDANDNIVSSGGTIDAASRKVTVFMTWDERGTPSSYSIVTYITNLHRN